MITGSLTVVLGIVAFFLWKGNATTWFAAIVFTLLGITLAGTVLGPPMISGVESGANAVFQGLGDALAGGR